MVFKWKILKLFFVALLEIRNRARAKKAEKEGMEQELKVDDSGKENEKCEKDENEQEKNEAEESDSDKDESEDADEDDDSDEETENKDDDEKEDDETEYKDIDEKEEKIEKQDQLVNENPSENIRNEFEDGKNQGEDQMFCEEEGSVNESDHKSVLTMEDTGKEYIGKDVLKNTTRQDKMCHQGHSDIVPNDSEAETVSLASEVDLSITIDMQHPSDKNVSMAWVTESKVTSTDEVANNRHLNYIL